MSVIESNATLQKLVGTTNWRAYLRAFGRTNKRANKQIKSRSSGGGLRRTIDLNINHPPPPPLGVSSFGHTSAMIHLPARGRK